MFICSLIPAVLTYILEAEWRVHINFWLHMSYIVIYLVISLYLLQPHRQTM